MAKSGTNKRQGLLKVGKWDFPLFAVVLCLCLFGLVMVLSSSYYYAYRSQSNGFFYFNKQAKLFVGGLILMIGVSFLPYKFYKKKWAYIGILAIAMILVFLTPIIGDEVNGAKRWIKIAGMSIQPAELAKFAIVIGMSAYMASNKEKLRRASKGIVWLTVVFFVPFAIGILLQKNLSTLIIVAATFVAMLLIGEIPTKHIVILGSVLGVALICCAVFQPYRLARITDSWFDPYKDPSGSGYQLIQSFYAISSGGLFGKGLNLSKQKLLFLTYGESDFIFAIIAEELGFFGCLLLIAGYLFLLYRGIWVAMRIKDRFGRFLASGISIIIALQAFIHMAVCVGLAPTTGQTLPFVSSGGTSLIIFMTASGILLNISRYIDTPFSKKQGKAKAEAKT